MAKNFIHISYILNYNLYNTLKIHNEIIYIINVNKFNERDKFESISNARAIHELRVFLTTLFFIGIYAKYNYFFDLSLLSLNFLVEVNFFSIYYLFPMKLHLIKTISFFSLTNASARRKMIKALNKF
jgi:hypothetical protein